MDLMIYIIIGFVLLIFFKNQERKMEMMDRLDNLGKQLDKVENNLNKIESNTDEQKDNNK